ncbi:hypothetical protein AX16_004657 [Volvariella volvacea WC 439]|nr:hypothetical protein AX16_004657 [Volvariella volvacea WC 439]
MGGYSGFGQLIKMLMVVDPRRRLHQVLTAILRSMPNLKILELRNALPDENQEVAPVPLKSLSRLQLEESFFPCSFFLPLVDLNPTSIVNISTYYTSNPARFIAPLFSRFGQTSEG